MQKLAFVDQSIIMQSAPILVMSTKAFYSSLLEWFLRVLSFAIRISQQVQKWRNEMPHR